MAFLTDSISNGRSMLNFTKRASLLNIVTVILFLDLLQFTFAANDCQVNSTHCIALPKGKTCFGSALKFQSTSLEFANDSSTLAEVDEKLKLWKGLQNVPQCWAVVQRFLCSVYLPKCNNTGFLEYPSKEECEKTRQPCKIVESFNNGWPLFLQCNQPHFKPNCKVCQHQLPSYQSDLVVFKDLLKSLPK